MAKPHHIVITPAVEPFREGFDVNVIPPPQGVGHDCEFRKHASALRYAEILSKASGWPIVDRTEGRNG